MSEIRAWKARDGEVFESQQDYFKHEAMLDLMDEMVDDDAYYYGVLQLHDFAELHAFLERNKSTILRVLGAAV